jgi:hypothetical protein
VSTLRRAPGIALVLALAACSAKSSAPYPTYLPTDASIANDVNLGASSGTVAITILAPTTGSILSTNASADVSAQVTIANGNDLIDPSSVRASLSTGTTAAGASIVSTVSLTGPNGQNQFVGKLPLAGLATGSYVITVTAVSSSGVTASKQVSVGLDAGPVITVFSPVPGQHYNGSLIVQLIVDPAMYPPLMGTPTAFIGGTALTLAASGSANQYRATVDLTKPMPLTGDQLFAVSAVDAKGTRTDLRFTFNVDIDGPTITNTSPAPGAIVGGVIQISASIADGAGLNASSLQVLIGDKTDPQFKLPLTLDPASGLYSVLFDTKNLTGCKPPPDSSLCIVFPTLSFRASDALGNDTTFSYDISVDNLPPIADLVPPVMRVSKYDTSPNIDGGVAPPGLSCSHAFDPLSNNSQPGDMPDDGCMVPQVFDLRARIEDDGNRAAGLKGTPLSLVDPNATAVYVLDNVTQPLVVDTDGDGACDAINPNLVPTTTPLTNPNQVLKIRMQPVPPAGDGDYTADPTVPEPPCIPGHEPNPPTDICHREEPTVAISYAAGQPAIWAIEPIAPADPQYCFGGQFDTLANNVHDAGWKCIAVQTADMNGNTSVSAPIRVWVSYSNQGSAQWCAPLPTTAGPPPTCMGTYNKSTGTATAGSCTTRKFSIGQICFDNDC